MGTFSKHSRTWKLYIWTKKQAGMKFHCDRKLHGKFASTKVHGFAVSLQAAVEIIQVAKKFFQRTIRDQTILIVKHVLTVKSKLKSLLFSFLDIFHINPQLYLFPTDMEEVVISLNQHAIMDPKVRMQKSFCFFKSCTIHNGEHMYIVSIH